MTPLPHPAQGMGKKADMLEANVLVKKYRGGGQEDYLTKGFALFFFIFPDLPVDISIYYKFKVFFICHTLKTFFFFYSLIQLSFLTVV